MSVCLTDQREALSPPCRTQRGFPSNLCGEEALEFPLQWSQRTQMAAESTLTVKQLPGIGFSGAWWLGGLWFLHSMAAFGSAVKSS